MNQSNKCTAKLIKHGTAVNVSSLQAGHLGSYPGMLGSIFESEQRATPTLMQRPATPPGSLLFCSGDPSTLVSCAAGYSPPGGRGS